MTAALLPLAVASSNGKLLWYVTRGTGVVALVLLSAGVLLGVMSSTRWHPARTPRFLVLGLHRNVSLLGLAFVVVHVVTTVVDHFAPIGYQDAVLPFLSPYRPVWLGLGAVAFDLLLALIVTSLLRARIGLQTWRAVHWLAYAAWPVALMHSFGTGSDARSGWLAALAMVCTGAVGLAVLWRVAAATRAPVQIRGAAAFAAFAVPLGMLVWANSGPLRKGWASRAGTPASLLAAFRGGASAPASQPSSAVVPPSRPALPDGSFTATFRGRVNESPAANGLVTVTIDGVASGGFNGRVHVALRGVPLSGGGVEMLESSVALLPRGGGAWDPGHVVALEGQHVTADVVGAGTQRVRVLFTLQIDPASGRVSGSIHGGHRPGPSA
ncbi:MAG TPA: ferric reductase-like transmembrane domain-containing protein [Gaiellaceae bacterium]|nr:ferric reductase-like transmembrane domain-containing protein [Gaiellaceae bacterium]